VDEKITVRPSRTDSGDQVSVSISGSFGVCFVDVSGRDVYRFVFFVTDLLGSFVGGVRRFATTKRPSAIRTRARTNRPATARPEHERVLPSNELNTFVRRVIFRDERSTCTTTT